MLNEEQVKVLFNKSKDEKIKWSSNKSCSTIWEKNCHAQWLYKLACEVKSVDSMRSDEIFPVFMSEDGLSLIKQVVRSEYYFWEVIHGLSFEDEIGEISAVKRAISAIRAYYTRTWVDRKAALENRMTPQQICQFTAMGIILWDFDKNNWVLNPLWFSPKELSRCNG
jgi:hypothetical protein